MFIAIDLKRERCEWGRAGERERENSTTTPRPTTTPTTHTPCCCVLWLSFSVCACEKRVLFISTTIRITKESHSVTACGLCAKYLKFFYKKYQCTSQAYPICYRQSTINDNWRKHLRLIASKLEDQEKQLIVFIRATRRVCNVNVCLRQKEACHTPHYIYIPNRHHQPSRYNHLCCLSVCNSSSQEL